MACTNCFPSMIQIRYLEDRDTRDGMQNCEEAVVSSVGSSVYTQCSHRAQSRPCDGDIGSNLGIEVATA